MKDNGGKKFLMYFKRILFEVFENDWIILKKEKKNCV